MWLFLYIAYEYEQYQKDVDDEHQLLRVLGLVVVQTVPVPTVVTLYIMIECVKRKM